MPSLGIVFPIEMRMPVKHFFNDELLRNPHTNAI